MSECSHKFVDSKVCLKCGWEPPPRRLTVGMVIRELQQLPPDTPVLAGAEGMGPTAYSLKNVEHLGWMVWPRASGPTLIIGNTIALAQMMRQHFGVDIRRLKPRMEMPEPPERSDAIEALEDVACPVAVLTLMGLDPVNDKDGFREAYEKSFQTPVPEWATLKDEDELYAEMDMHDGKPPENPVIVVDFRERSD